MKLECRSAGLLTESDYIPSPFKLFIVWRQRRVHDFYLSGVNAKLCAKAKTQSTLSFDS
ncbi:hypothetical protein D3C72_2308220 [compost metagenome]